MVEVDSVMPIVTPMLQVLYWNVCDNTLQIAIVWRLRKEVNESNGYPPDYNPCEHMERIRFSMCFGSIPNSKIEYCLDAMDQFDSED